MIGGQKTAETAGGRNRIPLLARAVGHLQRERVIGRALEIAAVLSGDAQITKRRRKQDHVGIQQESP